METAKKALEQSFAKGGEEEEEEEEEMMSDLEEEVETDGTSPPFPLSLPY